MSTKVSPLAPKLYPELPPIEGVRLASIEAGIKYVGRKDLCLIAFDKPAEIAGVFTKSKCSSAPVDWCRKHIKKGTVRGIVINAGNANVFTGRIGREAVEETANAAAAALRCKPEEVMLASTGVIGERLAVDRLTKALPGMVSKLADNKWRQTADAIRTTDTFAKSATATAKIGNTDVTIGGIAKGSGMIAPDMATMLSFIFTDAKLPSSVVQRLIKEACDVSFNAITVDGDTSTSDTVLLCATGKAKRHKKIEKASDPALADFKAKLAEVCTDLAHQIVKDGEGASKFIEIQVAGAESKKAARKIGLTIANSPLVKTAIAGEDANWGRIIMAVGRSGEQANRDKLGIKICGVEITRNGDLLESYQEADVAPKLKGQNIDIAVDVGVGRGKATVWTCDLTHEYIAINADYRS